MIDLDQLLVDDAGRDRLDPPPARSLDDALEHARVSTRRRHTLTTGLALTAVGVVGGGLLYAAATPTPQHASDTRLAAYDQVLGPDVSRPGQVLVLGPADKHTAHCTRVPGVHVDVHRTRVPGVHVYVYRHEGQVMSILVKRQVMSILVKRSARYDNDPSSVSTRRVFHGSPPGPYFVFRCPTS